MVKAALIGCGRMGAVHAEILIRDGFLLNALFDTNIKSISSIKDKLKIYEAKGFNDEKLFFNFLEENKIELVVIASTTIGRAKLIIKLLNIGIPYIFSEKPICSSIFEIENILSSLKISNSNLAINHQMRYLPQYQRVKELANEDRFGGLNSMHVVGGNFGLAMNGSHYVEAFRYMTDSYSKSVKAELETENEYSPRGDIFKEASGFAKIKTDDNHFMTINCSNKNHYGRLVTYICKYGILNVDELSGNLYGAYRKKEFRNLPSYKYGVPADIIRENIDSVETVRSTSMLLKDLLNGGDYPTASQAINAIKTIIACYYSSRKNGSQIELNELDKNNQEIFKWA